MIAAFISILDLSENRRSRFSPPERRETAERIYFRHLHRLYERAMKRRKGL